MIDVKFNLDCMLLIMWIHLQVFRYGWRMKLQMRKEEEGNSETERKKKQSKTK